MHESLKKICKGLEKEFESYAHNMSNDRLKMGEKDAERLKNLALAMVGMKVLKMLEGMKEDGEKEGKGGMGGMLHAMGKQIGGGHSGMQAMMNAIGLPHIPGFTGEYNPQHGSPYGNPHMNHYIESRRGVPGSGSPRGAYDETDDDMEMRRGRSSRTGRYVHRAEMEDNYDMNMAGGQGGNSGGQSGGNTGGGRR